MHDHNGKNIYDPNRAHSGHKLEADLGSEEEGAPWCGDLRRYFLFKFELILGIF